MIEPDWGILILGVAVGALASALFFAGLAFGMRVAMNTTHPALVLLLSAGLRIALLLAVGWFVARTGAWAFAGFAASFLLVRLTVIIFARVRPQKKGAVDGTDT